MAVSHLLATVSQLPAVTIRWIHLVALAILLGGALVMWLADHPPIDLARRYEYLFWLAIGLVVVSGVGNVGLLTGGVPGFSTLWGRLFSLKLLAVLGLVVVSVVRLGVVLRAPEGGYVDRRWYLLTTLWVGALVAIAVVMVRG